MNKIYFWNQEKKFLKKNTKKLLKKNIYMCMYIYKWKNQTHKNKFHERNEKCPQAFWLEGAEAPGSGYP